MASIPPPTYEPPVTPPVQYSLHNPYQTTSYSASVNTADVLGIFSLAKSGLVLPVLVSAGLVGSVLIFLFIIYLVVVKKFTIITKLLKLAGLDSLSNGGGGGGGDLNAGIGLGILNVAGGALAPNTSTTSTTTSKPFHPSTYGYNDQGYNQSYRVRRDVPPEETEIDRLARVVMAALSSHECQSKVICELGVYSRSTSYMKELVGLVEPMIPDMLRSNFDLFKRSSVDGESCDVYKCEQDSDKKI